MAPKNSAKSAFGAISATPHMHNSYTKIWQTRFTSRGRGARAGAHTRGVPGLDDELALGLCTWRTIKLYDAIFGAIAQIPTPLEYTSWKSALGRIVQ